MCTIIYNVIVQSYYRLYSPLFFYLEILLEMHSMMKIIEDTVLWKQFFRAMPQAAFTTLLIICSTGTCLSIVVPTLIIALVRFARYFLCRWCLFVVLFCIGNLHLLESFTGLVVYQQGKNLNIRPVWIVNRTTRVWFLS